MKVFEARLTVRSYECDSYGHVNNAVYLNYLEFARMEALFQEGFTLEQMKRDGYLVVIRRIEIDYKYPVTMGDDLVIKTYVEKSGKTSGTFVQQIFKEEDQRLVADARVTWVFTNLAGKPISIPPVVRQAFGMVEEN